MASSSRIQSAAQSLPIGEVLGEVRRSLTSANAVVVQAPPGAGKTTVVPLALLEEAWLTGRRIVMLEPRRLAARAAARRMADLLGESVGETVGHRMRLDTRIGRNTRIEVVTEGVLTRMLLADPTLDGVGAVLFDEFHERSLQSDTGLALARHTQRLIRDDLRIVVMSATLDGEPIATLLGGAPIVTSEGRAHSVEVRYRAKPKPRELESAVAAVVAHVLADEPGDVLVFLPGQAEIRRVAARLRESALPSHVGVIELYGALSAADQDVAIRPAPAGRRKVVLATSIAETSLTIEGVRVVVDSGLSRLPRFSPRTGMSHLATVPVSRAAAEQRRGRAGRLGPGVCYRLWSQQDDLGLLPFHPPEILHADLAPLALDLAAAGVSDPRELEWLDAPPEGAYAHAAELLRELDAVRQRRITPHGRAIAGLGAHPRLAHMMLAAAERARGAVACDLAALVSERDILRAAADDGDADVRLRLEVLQAARRGSHERIHRGVEVNAGTVRAVLALSAEWRRRLRVDDGPGDVEDAGAVLALAYPDRIAQRRPGRDPRYLLRNGRGAVLPSAQALGRSEFLAIAELDGSGAESRIRLAAPLDDAEVRSIFAAQIEVEQEIDWDVEARAVRPRRRERLGAIVLGEVALAALSAAEMGSAMVDVVRREGIGVLPWDDAAAALRARLAFLHSIDNRWPDVSDAALASTAGEWLVPMLEGRRGDELRRVDVAEALRRRLAWDQRALLERLAPTHWTVPSGSRIPIDYSDPAAPVLAVRLQEVFGLVDTPRIAEGRVPLTLHLLSPARRPVQVTRDLGGFWRTTYFEVKKDLKGRYPKHYWPDDPLAAIPTSRTRPRG